MNIGESEFLGPTLSAAALGLAIPLVSPSEKDIFSQKLLQGIDQPILLALQAKGVKIRNPQEEKLISVTWIIIIIGILLWDASLHLALGNNLILIPHELTIVKKFQTSIVIGFGL